MLCSVRLVRGLPQSDVGVTGLSSGGDIDSVFNGNVAAKREAGVCRVNRFAKEAGVCVVSRTDNTQEYSILGAQVQCPEEEAGGRGLSRRAKEKVPVTRADCCVLQDSSKNSADS